MNGTVARRVVLLGASNLTKGISTVISAAESAWGEPLEVLTALGHGRSYGRTTTVLGRTLPGILPCDLWHDLARRDAVPTAALVTDIGNDLLYEEPVATILGWVEQCLDRLAEHGAQTIVTLLPIENIASLSRARFTLLRSVLFPRCRLDLATCARRAVAINEGVQRLAQARGMSLAVQRPAWYGFDPVHIRRAQRPAAWREIMANWQGSSSGHLPSRVELGRTIYLRTRVPHRRRLLGFEQRRPQPAARLPGGTTVALY